MDTLLDWNVLMLEPKELLPNLLAVGAVATGSYGLYWVTGIRSPFVPLVLSALIVVVAAIHTGHLNPHWSANSWQAWGLVGLSSFGLFLNFFAPNDLVAILLGSRDTVAHAGGRRPLLIRWVL